MNRLITNNLIKNIFKQHNKFGTKSLFHTSTCSGPAGPFSEEQLILLEITEFIIRYVNASGGILQAT
jgi:hypothetical protein